MFSFCPVFEGEGVGAAEFAFVIGGESYVEGDGAADGRRQNLAARF